MVQVRYILQKDARVYFDIAFIYGLKVSIKLKNSLQLE